MILAAGVGSRLRPLTDTTPKALVDIGGMTMLELALRRLAKAGVSAVIVNAHHKAAQIETFLKRGAFGLKVEVSLEEELLDTGGGLKKAAWFFEGGEPFFLYNVDVLTDLDLDRLYRHHREHPALATMAVRQRKSARRLLFSPDGALQGREGDGSGEALAFDGVHVLAPELLPLIKETGVFPLIDVYLRLAREKRRIQAFRSDEYFWQGIDTPERLERARARVRDFGAPV